MINAVISPNGSLELLSKSEIAALQCGSGTLYSKLFRNCTLAVLSTGANSDDGHQLLATHADFEVELIAAPRGVKLKLSNAPDNAFVDGEIMSQGFCMH